MRTPSPIKLTLLALALFPLLGTVCMKEKTLELVLTGSTVIESIQARGSVNVEMGSSSQDLKDGLDLRQLLLDNGINPDQLIRIGFKGLQYRIVKPQAGREVSNGTTKIQFGSRSQALLATGHTVSADAETDWIDVSEYLEEPGVSEINAFLARCLVEIQGGPDATDTVATVTWGGVSSPTTVNTDFDYDVKILVNILFTETAELPDF